MRGVLTIAFPHFFILGYDFTLDRDRKIPFHIMIKKIMKRHDNFIECNPNITA